MELVLAIVPGRMTSCPMLFVPLGYLLIKSSLKHARDETLAFSDTVGLV